MGTAKALPAWSLALQGPEYRWLIPGMSALPDDLAYALARRRGRFNARHDRDWVSLGLQRQHVAPQVANGYALFLGPAQVKACVDERFETVAREEMEARALERHGLQHFQVDAQDALDALHQRPKKRGIVLVTAHLDTFVLGIAALAQRGEVIHPVMSEVSADPRLHPAIREHFVRKYAGLQRHLNGGQLASAETSMRHFYLALARGEAVVVLSDSPAPTPGTGLCVPWMGEHRRMAQGALRLAETTGSLLAAFACRWHEGRHHSVHLSALLDPGQSGAQACARQAFAFLEQHILAAPGRWWASHLLPACGACAPVACT